MGIPVVVDRLVQQMILQVLEPHPRSHLFQLQLRIPAWPRRRTMALEQARKYVAQEGREITRSTVSAVLLTLLFWICGFSASTLRKYFR